MKYTNFWRRMCYVKNVFDLWDIRFPLDNLLIYLSKKYKKCAVCCRFQAFQVDIFSDAIFCLQKLILHYQRIFGWKKNNNLKANLKKVIWVFHPANILRIWVQIVFMMSLLSPALLWLNEWLHLDMNFCPQLGISVVYPKNNHVNKPYRSKASHMTAMQ